MVQGIDCWHKVQQFMECTVISVGKSRTLLRGKNVALTEEVGGQIFLVPHSAWVCDLAVIDK